MVSQLPSRYVRFCGGARADMVGVMAFLPRNELPALFSACRGLDFLLRPLFSCLRDLCSRCFRQPRGQRHEEAHRDRLQSFGRGDPAVFVCGRELWSQPGKVAVSRQ